MNFAVDGQPRLAVLDQRPRVPSPEGPTAAEEEDRLENAGLAGAIRTADEIPRRLQVELRFRDASKSRDSYAAQGQERQPL